MKAVVSPPGQRGFTLVELIMVIVIMGVIGGMVSVFMKSPIDAYIDSGRRAALTDVADTAARRIARDLQKALPNSIRVSTDQQCIEFIPTKTGGRYRADETAAALNFDVEDMVFNMLGSNSALQPNQRIVAGDVIAVYNLGIEGANAYGNSNISAVTGVGTELVIAPGTGPETPISISGKQFPLASGANRFHVIPGNEKVVSYVCSGDKLYRNANYAYTAAIACPAPVAGTTPELASNVVCAFDYSGSDLQRNALVKISLTFTKSDESVRLYQEVHVNNTP